MDESFSPDDTGNYGLAMLLGETAVSFCILDLKRNKFLGLQRYLRKDMLSPESRTDTGPAFMEFLTGILTAVPWLKDPFKTVKIAYDGKKSTLVPAAYFNQDEKEHFLNFNFSREKEELVFSDHLMPLDAWLIFTVPAPVVDAAREIFPKCRVIHASSLLIESIWINYKNRITASHVFLHLREPLLDLMIFDGKQMYYFNTFTFRAPEDIVYYLIFVLEQLDLNPETIPLVMLGTCEAEESLPDLLNRYMRHIETGKRNDAYSYSYVLNKLPYHASFPLLNFFSCGL